MAIREAMQSASRKLIGRSPATFFDANGKFEAEMADLVNEVAQDVVKYQDWQALVRVATITGTGSQTDFALPSDYDRMTVNSRVQDTTNWAWGYGHVRSVDDFISLQTEGFGPLPGIWTLYADMLRFYPAPGAGSVAKFSYITKNWAMDGPTPTASFTRDSDKFALPERLLMLGLVWRWRENKKLDASGDQEAFIKALDEYAAKDSGPFVLRRNVGRRVPGSYPAWPGVLGPATY